MPTYASIRSSRLCQEFDEKMGNGEKRQVDDELLIDDPVSQPQELAREVFASTDIAALPR